MQKTTGIALIVTYVALAGCDQIANKQDVQQLQSQVQSLTTRLDAAQQQESTLQVTVGQLETRLRDLEFKDMVRQWDGTAYLTPGGEGYSAVKFDLGILTVQISNIVPYANGSKVTLKLGNTLSAEINGLKASVDWGQVDKAGMPMNETSKTKSVTFPQSLKPGAWNSVSVILDDTPPAAVGFLRLHNVAHTGINLYVR